MSEQKIEAMIQERKLTAPRLTPADIDNAIMHATYTEMPSGKCMICEITLRNGFTVRGESACVSRENFNREIGKEVSYNNARNKVWELEGYLLQEYIHTDQAPIMTGNTRIDSCTKTLHNSDISGARANVKDIKVSGDGDLFKLLCKASSEKEGWMKSTKAMAIEGCGCVVQVTTQQRNPDGSYAVAEAVCFVPDAVIRPDPIHNGRRLARKF